MNKIKLSAVSLFLLLPIALQAQYRTITTDNSGNSSLTFSGIAGAVWISITPDPDPASGNQGVYCTCAGWANRVLANGDQVLLPGLNTTYEIWVQGAKDCFNLWTNTQRNPASTPANIIMNGDGGSSVTMQLIDAFGTLGSSKTLLKHTKSDYDKAFKAEVKKGMDAGKPRRKIREWNSLLGGPGNPH